MSTLAKVAAGFALGLALWIGFSSSYATFVAGMAEPLIRLGERPAVTTLRSEGTTIIVDRTDFPRSSPRPQLPLNDLTFNIILLTALFASNRAVLSTENVTRFLLACLVLSATHVLAFVASVQSVYALQMGPWSKAHYGTFSRNFWAGSSHFYRLVGLYGFAFALWWFQRPVAGEAAPSRKTLRKRKKPAGVRK